MPKYLVTYHDGGEPPTGPEANAQMMEAFGAWATSVGSALTDPGAPLSHAKTVSVHGVKDGQDRAKIEGYTLLQANDLDHAVSLVQGHPFLARGGNLQVSQAIDLH
jgi:hypothetical protein